MSLVTLILLVALVVFAVAAWSGRSLIGLGLALTALAALVGRISIT